MKNALILVLLLLFSFFLAFGLKTEKIDKTKEDGVEVILNHHKPYVLEGSPFNPLIEQKSVIDLEDPEMTDIGLYDILT